jgi:hypothetical protein
MIIHSGIVCRASGGVWKRPKRRTHVDPIKDFLDKSCTMSFAVGAVTALKNAISNMKLFANHQCLLV